MNTERKNIIKICSFVIALALVICTLFLVNKYYDAQIEKISQQNENTNINKLSYLCYQRSPERDNSIENMKKIFDENSLLMLGSSELGASDNIAYPQALLKNGNSNFNIIMSGQGYVQSLLQTIKIGAYEPIMKNRKVVLILSPQWFTESQAQGESFDSQWLQPVWKEFLKNPQITSDLKEKVKQRAIELSSDGGGIQNSIRESVIPEDVSDNVREATNEHDGEASENVNSKISPNKSIFDWVKDKLEGLRRNIIFVRKLYQTYAVSPKFDMDDEPFDMNMVDFDKLMLQAEEEGKKSCTNNEFGVYDEYFDKYIQYRFENLKDSETESTYGISKEYEDLRLFLEVCKKTDLDVLLISMPVNGRWYDYLGFPKDGREVYYNKIREISKAYGAELADFSDKEYEMYFLKDIMHCGWKGWVYIDEAVYKFYLQNKK